jgi:hypothetical protein
MDEQGSSSASSLRELAEKILLAGLGLVAATKDKAEAVVGADDSPTLSERAKATLAGLADDLGLVREDRHEELELKIAQIEHRLRLLEERAERETSGS